MKKYILPVVLLLLALCPSDTMAQLIERKVISSAGMLYQNPGISVSATLGETFTTTITNGNAMLTQGFQQPELPECSLKINNGMDTLYFCGTSGQLTADPSFNSFSWSNGATTATTTVTASGWYVCIAGRTACSATDSIYVSFVGINPAPAISGASSICQNTSTTLSVASGFSSYLWNNGASTASITTSVAGNYTVTITNAFGCSATTSKTVTINANPVVSISGALTICQGNAATLSAPSGFSSYLWNTGATTPSINPGLAGSYTVTVTNASGCTGTDTKTLTVNPVSSTTQTVNRCPGDLYTLPSGQVVSTNGSYNSVLTANNGCDSIIVTNISFSDNTAPVVLSTPSSITTCNPASWIPPTFSDNCSYTISSNFQPGMNLPIGVTTVTYTATDISGNAVSTSFNVTVVTASTASTGIVSNRDFNNICIGQNITLSVVGGSLGDQASWKWYATTCGGSGNLIGQGPSVTLTPSATTTYFVRAEGSCNITACSSVNVIVSTTAPNISPSLSNLPPSGSPGVTDTVCVNPVPGAVYYQWYTINGQNQSLLFNGQTGPVQTTGTCVNISYVTPQQNYFVRVFAGNACGRTNQTVVNNIRGTVPATTCINGPLQVCSGQSYTYNACPIPWQTAVTYNWQIYPDVPGTASIVFNGTTATVNYSAGFTSAQICVNGISIIGLPGPSYCITVVNNAPAPGAITGNVLPCQGATEAYSILPVANAISYNWTTNINGAAVSAGGTSASVSFPPNAFSGNICVTAITTCGITPQSCLSLNADMPGYPGPITGPIVGLCNASNVNYSLNTSNALSYNWTAPTGVNINGGSNLNAVNLNFSSGFTSGVIMVEAFYNCGSTTSTISVSGLPQVPSVTPELICPLTTEQYAASSYGASSYIWTLSGYDFSSCLDMPICSEYFVTWGPSGGSLSVVASNSCGSSAAFNLSGYSCKSEMESSQMHVYPNPNHGNFTLEYVASSEGSRKITLMDVSGKVCLSREMDFMAGTNTVELREQSLEAGLYILQVIDQDGAVEFVKISVL